MGSLTVYMYHDINDLSDVAYPMRYLKKSFISPSRFKKHLDYITYRKTVISARELVHLTTLDLDYAVLTFDDGLSDHFHVAELLHERGLNGSFFIPVHPVQTRQMMDTHKIQFIIAETVGKWGQVIADILSHVYHPKSVYNKYSKSLWKKNDWFPEEVFITRFLREYPDRKKRKEICDELFRKYVSSATGVFEDFYLTTSQIQYMQSAGMVVGGHGYFSENLLTYPQLYLQEEDLSKTKQFLISLGIQEFFFSYPNGGVDDKIVGLMQQLGFTLGFSTQNIKITSPLWSSTNHLWIPRIDAPQTIPV